MSLLLLWVSHSSFQFPYGNFFESRGKQLIKKTMSPSKRTSIQIVYNLITIIKVHTSGKTHGP